MLWGPSGLNLLEVFCFFFCCCLLCVFFWVDIARALEVDEQDAAG